MDSKRISFVVVNYNGARFLPGCLDSIINQTTRIDQIILVDNCSTDNSVNLVKSSYPFVDVFVMHANLGLSEAYNFGMRIANNDWVILANNDIVLDANCVEKISCAAASSREVATPLFLSIRNPQIKQSCPVIFVPSIDHPWTSLRLKFSEGEVCATDIAGFGLLLVNKKEVGPIDERFPLYFGEDDFSLECRHKGIEIVFVSSSRVFHYGSGTIGRLSLKKIRLFLRGWVTYRVKWFPIWSLLPSTFFAIVLQWYQHLFAIAHLEVFRLRQAPPARSTPVETKRQKQ